MAPESVSVLILDDEPFLRQSIRDYLLDEGRFEVFVAGDGESGLDLLERERIDVCLVDLRLPGISGIEFMARAQQGRPDLRFLIHTGSPEEQLPKATIQGFPGYRGVLFKPLADMRELVRAIDNALR